MKSTIIYICNKLICLIDFIFYCNKTEKIISDFDIENEMILTPLGFKPFSKIYMTKPFEIYVIKTYDGQEIECADTHILYDEFGFEKLAKDFSIGDFIKTKNGVSVIKLIEHKNDKQCMFDITVDSNKHTFYSNDFVSHNSTTTAIYCLWMAIYHADKNCLVLSKSGPAGADLIKKIKDMYMYLPFFIRGGGGILKWNQSEISFDNNSSIATEPFSPTAGLGKTINFLILDEFAWCPPSDVELFYSNIIPTVTTISDSNVCIMSTQNGFNLFYKLYNGAITGKNIYAPFKVDWYQVPQFNPETKQWDKRDEEWKKMMVGVLGSEESFYYQYGTVFSASDKCIISRETISRLRDKTILYESIEKNTNHQPIYSLYWKYLFFEPDFDVTSLKEKFIIILIDLAEGSGNDYTIFNFIELTGDNKFKQIGYWRCNTVDIEQATLEFWCIYPQLFTPDRCIVSIEWNTYGALFYNYLMQYNEDDYKPEYLWRFQVNQYGEFDNSNIIYYKKGSQEEEIAALDVKFRNKQTLPGIRFNGGNKKTACALLKMNLEKDLIDITDLVTVSEIENFEDKGNGTYAAAYGHDDLIMTFCQIPMLVNTPRYKSFLEEFMANVQVQNFQASLDPQSYGYFSPTEDSIYASSNSTPQW
jgi:hypothetical protein